MTLTPGLIEFEAVLSTLADDLNVAVSMGQQEFGRLHLVRQPGRLVVAAGGEVLTVGEMADAVSALADVCPPLLPVFARDEQGREFPLLLVPGVYGGRAVLDTDPQPLTEAMKVELAARERE